MEIRPLAAKVVANTSGNKSTIGNAQCVYICATADDLITNVATGGTIQMHENQSIVIIKEKFEELFSGANTTHFTKIAYPRG
tara:strand:- start:1328 stop:1573 length:246 start_codon:yes stop_codon:yes gene_type:complete